MRIASGPLLMLLVATLCAAASPTLAGGSGVEIVGLRLGLGGAYKLGCWTPAEVTLRGGDESESGAVRVALPDSDGVAATFSTPTDKPVHVAAGTEMTARLLVRVGKTEATARVEFVGEDGPTAMATLETDSASGDGAASEALPATDRVMLFVGPDLGLDTLARDSAAVSVDLGTLQLLRMADPGGLPEHWLGYEGVETVIVVASEAEAFMALPRRLAALERWVRSGGRLVLFCGEVSPVLLSEGGPFSPLLPGRFVEMVPLRESLALEAFAGVREPLVVGRLNLDVPKLDAVTGLILSHSGRQPTDLPLLIRSPLGFGEVTFAAVDPASPLLQQWKGYGAFLKKVLRLDEQHARSDDAQAVTASYSQIDLAAVLQVALDRFNGVEPVSFGLVALLAVVYILLIGPGDYLLVTRVLRRPEYTWVTFPVAVVGVSVGVYVLGHWLRGDHLRVNLVEVVDVDTAEGDVRGTVWTHFTTPEAVRYDLRLEPALIEQPLSDADAAVAWLGMPGLGLGGMQGTGSRESLFSAGYTESANLSRLEGLPVQVWSTRTLTARWSAVAEGLLPSELVQTEDGELVEGRLTNGTGAVLSDCVLLYGRWAYSLPKLSPGRSLEVTPRKFSARTSKTLLTNASAGDETMSRTLEDGTVAFDWQSDDVSRILKSMMFYERINGRKYTGRLNHYQQFVDLSHLLTPDRAILLARVEAPGSHWQTPDGPLASDGDRRWLYYRFVLPVKQ